MIYPIVDFIIRWFSKFSRKTKDTTSYQRASLRTFMKALKYGGYSEGGFVGNSIVGCRIISFRTAVQLHNEKNWIVNVVADKKYQHLTTQSPAFNPTIRVLSNDIRRAQKAKIVEQCKLQWSKSPRDNASNIITQSHIVKFVDKEFGQRTGML